jgi:hypothetical protein
MPTYKEATIAMIKYFETQWDSETPIILGNDDPRDTPDDSSFVRFNINHTTGNQASIGAPGANLFRNFGLIVIQVFNPQSNYGINVRDLSNDIIDFYKGTVDSDIHYYNARINEVGNDGNGFNQNNVVVEFYYDNIT